MPKAVTKPIYVGENTVVGKGETMNVSEKIKLLREKAHELKNNKAKAAEKALPSGCYFIDDDELLCEKRAFGDARYPYSNDGLTLWAYSSGNVKIEESTFNAILTFTEGKEPNLAFYTALKTGEGYFPLSITGVGKLPFEKNVERYTVFTPDAAYYFVEADGLLACVRMFVDCTKTVRFTLYAENEGEKQIETYLSAYFNCLLSHASCENIETKWYRTVKATDDGFAFSVTEYVNRATCFVHKATLARDSAVKPYSTTSHTDFCGGMHNQLCCSTALQNGRFEQNARYTEFTDTAIAGDIIPLTLKTGESFAASYSFTLTETAAEKTSTEDIDALLYAPKAADAVGQNIPKLKLEGKWKGLDGSLLNSFVKNVFRQTEFCARAKNYAGPFIGIRDIFQQLEAALMWIPDYCRGKIVEALNYIGENGRAPRQYSYPENKNVAPPMDLRPFIDQGVWIISTVYKYLCYTGDFTILSEECGYYKFNGNTVELCSERDDVLSHLIRIADYLVSNLDDETNCLHALYGDWNDALDGLGKTEDAGKEYGSGVSVMATLQLYANLKELAEILKKSGREADAEKYLAQRERVKNGLLKYAVVQNDKGERKILHGWFDKREAFVGSFCDNDGLSRDGLTSNAYWILSGMLACDESLKNDVLAAYRRLDSKYGLKTFEPYFSKENTKVGRINRLPKGTAENGATYIHATLFGIWSLFEIGEAELAWEQLYKILPVTHEFISTTPFVMPNSYVFNEERGFDGESMSDWFTGSGCVLLKVLLWEVFGIRADLDGVRVTPPEYMPFDKAELDIKLRGELKRIVYEKNADGKVVATVK